MSGIIEHTNKRGVRYFLHRRLDARGRERLVFARDVGEGALSAVPDGFEIRETLNGTVSLAKVQTRVIREVEEQLVRAAVARAGNGRRKTGDFVVEVSSYDVEVRDATVFVHEGHGVGIETFSGRMVTSRPRFRPLVRFDLVDREQRIFEVKRMTSRGAGGWSYPLHRGPLRALVAKVVPHLGRDSFFDLM